MTEEAPARVRIEARGTDRGEAVEMFRELYHGLRWSAAEVEGRPFSYSHHAIGDESMTLRTSSFHGGRLDGEILPTGDEFIVNWVTTGGGVVDVGAAEVAVAPGTPVLFPADRPFRFSYADFDQKLVHLDRGLVERVAAEQTGIEHGELRVDGAVVPGRDAVRTWGQAMGLISRTLIGAPASPLLRAEMSRLAAIAFLELYPQLPVSLPPALLVPGNARVRTAVEFIHANAHLPITPTAAAKAAGLGVRALQDGFRRALDTSPSEYLRAVRLDHVHSELRRADPGETSVKDIALRWGFAHLGRFSGVYAERFGEYPSTTLRAVD
ncbi:helix-turn-helix domain-containing protein [Curtobacterium sp. PhB136]|uniref:AraC family transcriptional regulator n=1 Tax=Curtobacterium sp. PhB136 TaxID=2485181 RepID=UPI00104EFDE1|nr:helix-turn-helix domain-containing protein [Curtobacterium sp. PhB136]